MDKNILDILYNTTLPLFVSKKYPRDKVACYWMQCSDGSYVDLSAYSYCHIGLNYFRNNPTDKRTPVAIINQVQQPSVPLDVAQRYYDWLLQQSPYRHAYITKEINLSSGQSPTIIVSTEHPPALVASSCIATRFATEQSPTSRIDQGPHCIIWDKLTQMGMDAKAAFVLAHSMKWIDDGWSFVPLNKQHSTLEECDVSTFWNFVHETPNITSKDMFSKLKTYSYNSAIWWGGGGKPNVKSIVKDAIAKSSSNRTKTNPFDISFVSLKYGEKELEAIVPVVNNLLKGELYA